MFYALKKKREKKNKGEGGNLNTIVTESTPQGELPVDVYQKLSHDRILFISNFIDDKLATDIVATLLLKDLEDSESKITIFINSEGGDIRSIFMIYDMMRLVAAPIETICIGSAMDEVTILLSSGTPGMRLATKNAIISLNQLTHEWSNLSDLTNAKKILDIYAGDNKRMMEIIAKNTGKNTKQIMADLDRRIFMSSNQAMKYGLIDKIITFNK